MTEVTGYFEWNDDKVTLDALNDGLKAIQLGMNIYKYVGSF